MEDINIYEDLEEFDSSEKLKLKIEEFNLLNEKYRSALKQIEELQLDRQSLQKKIDNIEKSFNSLLITARTEITRKTTQIAELRKELDDVCFRRGLRGRPMETRESLNASERRKDPHNPRHGYEKEPYIYDRISSHSKNREEKSVRRHKSSERDHSKPHNPFKESEDKSNPKYQTSSRRNSLKDESTKSVQSTSKYNEVRHRNHISIRKKEKLNDRRKEENSIDHRKQEKSIDHRRQEKSNSSRKEEKFNKYKKEEKTNMHNNSRNSYSKSLDKVEQASTEKLKNVSKTDRIYDSLPKLDLRQAVLESLTKDKVPNIPLETAAEIKHTKIERRISLSAYRNRMNTKCSGSEDNVNTTEGSGANNFGNADNSSVISKHVDEIINKNDVQLNENKLEKMQLPEKSIHQFETTLVQNKKDSPPSGKRKVVSKQSFEDILFDELVFQEDQNMDKRENHDSQDECLYAGLEIENVSEQPNKSVEVLENCNDCGSGGMQNKIEVPANVHDDKVPNSKAKLKISCDSFNVEPELAKEVENREEERNIHPQIESVKQSSKDFLSDMVPADRDELKAFRNDTNSDILPHQNHNPSHDKESERELNMPKVDEEMNSTNKAEKSLSISNIFDASFEPENNKSATLMSPYFGDQKTPVKCTNKSQLPKEHNNSIENEMAVMFGGSTDQLSIPSPIYQTAPSSEGDVAQERNVQNKAKEMFDLYLASPTNVIPSEIENSKDRSPPNPTITGMKKRKSSTPRKSPGLLNGRGLKLVGHRIEGFEPGIRGEKALEASKLKNALFKEILGNETSEEAAFRRNLQESNEEKDSHLNNEDVLEAQEENGSQIGEGSSKVINNEEDKIENVSENKDSKKLVRFDLNSELSNENEKSADDNKILKALECLENISDDDEILSDISSDFSGKQSINNAASEEQQGQKEIAENARSNDINTLSDKSTNSVENVKMEESKDLDDEEIPATDESQQKLPSKVENESFTELTIEEGDNEDVSYTNGIESDYNHRTNSVPFCSDKICVVIPLSPQDSIKSGEIDIKKSPTIYSSEIKIAEKKLHSLNPEIKDDIPEDEVNNENENLIPEDLLNQNTSQPNCKTKQIKKYVEDFCKTIESVEEETVSDSIRSQTSEQGTVSSMRKRQSIVTFTDFLNLPNRAKETNHSDCSEIIKPQSRIKLNLKNKRSKIKHLESRKSNIIKLKDKNKTEKLELELAEGSTKYKHKNPLQTTDCKTTRRHSKKIRGVFVRSLYVNSTQEKDIKILKQDSSTTKEVSVNELLFKSENFQSTRSLFKKDHSSDRNIDAPIKLESTIKSSPREDRRQNNRSFKPKMPLIRTISQKRKGSNVVSPKKKRRKIEIVYSIEDEAFVEEKGAGTSTSDEIIKKIDRDVDTPNCPALTKENIRKMLASLNQANSNDLKDSEDPEGCKENNKSVEKMELSTNKENKIISPPKELLPTELEAPPVSSDSSVSNEKFNLFEVPAPTCEKTEEQTHEKEDKKIKETLIELFGESPMPTPIPTPMPTPMPTPKRRNSDNDEVQQSFEQINGTNNNNNQEYELLKDKEFKRKVEKSVQNKEFVDKSKEFEEQTAQLSSDKNETYKNNSFINQEKENYKHLEQFDINNIKKDSLPVKCPKLSLTQDVIETEKQESIQQSVEDDKENISGAKRTISCLSDVSFDETKTESKIPSSLNTSGTDLKNVSTISMSSADYRIESVSSDVVNVFITRKRRKRKA